MSRVALSSSMRRIVPITCFVVLELGRDTRYRPVCRCHFGSCTCAGMRAVNVLPSPASLSTSIEPSMSWQNRWVMLRPSPVPPYLRVVDGSAWVNGWKSRLICAAVIPIPVSRTVKTISSRPFSRPRVAASETRPFEVNLLALLKRLSRIWRTRVRSARIAPMSSWIARSSVLPFFSTSGRTIAATAVTTSATSNVSREISILPASIFDRSSTSLIRPSRCLPDERILSRSGTRSVACSSSASSMRRSL